MPGKISAPIIRMRRIVKRFGDFAAIDGVDFDIYPGEVHALLGENGAGKTTLMNLLAGVYRQNEGRIELEGKPIRFKNPASAIASGIGMVHQHFAQVPNLTVAQNLALAMPGTPVFIDEKSLNQNTAALCEKFNLFLSPEALVCDLSVGERQNLEMLKLLLTEARVLILDEPTAVLTPAQTEELFTNLRTLTGQGAAVILITHKLAEVESIADRVTVLHRGRISIAAKPMSQWNREHIVTAMIGEKAKGEISTEATVEERVEGEAETVLELCDLVVVGDRGVDALCGLSLKVPAGKITAIAGVAGNGQRELAEAIIGLRKLKSGKRLFFGMDTARGNVKDIRALGVGFVPEDRMDQGVCLGLSVSENINLNRYALGSTFFPNEKRYAQHAENLFRDFEIKARDLDTEIRYCSGGNLQKAILAREIDSARRLLVVSQPTRGLDIEATFRLRRRLRELARSGVALLLISYDLDEIYDLADTVAVMVKGAFAAQYERPFPDRKSIGMVMTGGGCEA